MGSRGIDVVGQHCDAARLELKSNGRRIGKLTRWAAWTVKSAMRRVSSRRGVVWARPCSDGIYRRHGCDVVGGRGAGSVERASVGTVDVVVITAAGGLVGDAAEALRSCVLVRWGVVVVVLVLCLLLSVLGEICARGHAPQFVASSSGGSGGRRQGRSGRIGARRRCNVRLRPRSRSQDGRGVSVRGGRAVVRVDGLDGVEVKRARGVVGGGKR